MASMTVEKARQWLKYFANVDPASIGLSDFQVKAIALGMTQNKLLNPPSPGVKWSMFQCSNPECKKSFFEKYVTRHPKYCSLKCRNRAYYLRRKKRENRA